MLNFFRASFFFFKLIFKRTKYFTVSDKSKAKKEPWQKGFGPEISPVYVFNEIDVKENPEQVFDLVTKVSEWKNWFENSDKVILPEELEYLQIGLKFTWVKFGSSVNVEVLELEKNSRVTWKVTGKGFDLIHRWFFTKTEIGCKIEVEECQNGVLSKLFSGFMNREVHASHEDSLIYIKNYFAKPGIQFTETMRGFASGDQSQNYEDSYNSGKEKKLKLEFTLTIESDDIQTMLVDPSHKANITGEVIADILSNKPLKVIKGEFRLFEIDKSNVNTRKMWYRMLLEDTTGKRYYFVGFKIIDNQNGLEIWKDTTTLYVSLYEGETEQGKLISNAKIIILPSDFAKQLTTIEITNSEDIVLKTKLLFQFSEFFSKSLFDIYGGPLVNLVRHEPRKDSEKRKLKLPSPEIYRFHTEDGVELQLTRFKGGDSEPIILSHGLAVSSLTFNIDTIEENLTEYLVKNKYDVWLFDYRGSILLPSASTLFSGDEVAKFDYPACVKKVKEVTKKNEVHFLVHCFGATTFFMSMLQGLKDVKSFIVSQIGPHVFTPKMTEIKSGLHVPSVLESLGIKSLSAYTGENPNWRNDLFDKFLKIYPDSLKSYCNDPVCHRITFMFAVLYEHKNLNEATHNALIEMFGVGNMRAFEHLALIVRNEKILDFDGKDIYLPNLKNLNLPITFIHGSKNKCFLPESTEKTYEELKKIHGEKNYRRQVIEGYGHIDCLFGKNANKDVYPFVIEHLKKWSK